jgi:hypothetical protein
MTASTLATSGSVVGEQHPDDLVHSTSADMEDYWFYTSEGIGWCATHTPAQTKSRIC